MAIVYAYLSETKGGGEGGGRRRSTSAQASWLQQCAVNIVIPGLKVYSWVCPNTNLALHRNYSLNYSCPDISVEMLHMAGENDVTSKTQSAVIQFAENMQAQKWVIRM